MAELTFEEASARRERAKADFEMDERGSGVSLSARAALSFETKPWAQNAMLKSWGYDSRLRDDGRIVVMGPDSIEKFVDPTLFRGNDYLGDALDVLPGEGPGVVAETGGAIVGGTLGMGAGGPPGAFGGSILGGSSAGAGWDYVRQKIAQALGSPRGQDYEQTGQAAQWAGLGETAGQVGGLMRSSKIQDQLATEAHKYAPSAQGETVLNVHESAESAGIDVANLPAASLTGNKSLIRDAQWANSVDDLQYVTQQQNDAFKGDINRVLDEGREKAHLFNDSPAQLQPESIVEYRQKWLSNEWANAIEGQHQGLMDLEESLFKQTIEELPEGTSTPVQMALTLEAIDKEIAEVTKGRGRSFAKRISALENMRDDMAEWETVGDYLKAKSDFGELLFETNQFGTAANPIYSALLDDFGDAAINAGAPHAATLYDQARSIHKWQKDLQGNEIFRGWWKKQHKASKNTELNVRKIMKSFDDVIYSKDPNAIAVWKKNVGAQDAVEEGMPPGGVKATSEGKYVWGIFQQMAYDVVINKARTNAAVAGGTVVSGKALKNELERIGSGVVEELFGKEASLQIRALAELLNDGAIQKSLTANPSGTSADMQKAQGVVEKALPFLQPKKWAIRKSADRDTRNAAARLVMPSGSPGIPAGKDYYLGGIVPTRTEIAEAYAKMGIGPVTFDKAWRLAMQTAQRSLRPEGDYQPTDDPPISKASMIPTAPYETTQVLDGIVAGLKTSPSELFGLDEETFQEMQVPHPYEEGADGVVSQYSNMLQNAATDVANFSLGMQQLVAGMSTEDYTDLGMLLWGGSRNYLGSEVFGEQLKPEGQAFKMVARNMIDQHFYYRDPQTGEKTRALDKPFYEKPFTTLLDVAGAFLGGATYGKKAALNLRKAYAMAKQGKVGKATRMVYEQAFDPRLYVIPQETWMSKQADRVAERVQFKDRALADLDAQGLIPKSAAESSSRLKRHLDTALPPKIQDPMLPHGRTEAGLAFTFDRYPNPTGKQIVAGLEEYNRLTARLDVPGTMPLPRIIPKTQRVAKMDEAGKPVHEIVMAKGGKKTKKVVMETVPVLDEAGNPVMKTAAPSSKMRPAQLLKGVSTRDTRLSPKNKNLVMNTDFGRYLEVVAEGMKMGGANIEKWYWGMGRGFRGRVGEANTFEAVSLYSILSAQYDVERNTSGAFTVMTHMRELEKHVPVDQWDKDLVAGWLQLRNTDEFEVYGFDAHGINQLPTIGTDFLQNNTDIVDAAKSMGKWIRETGVKKGSNIEASRGEAIAQLQGINLGKFGKNFSNPKRIQAAKALFAKEKKNFPATKTQNPHSELMQSQYFGTPKGGQVKHTKVKMTPQQLKNISDLYIDGTFQGDLKTTSFDTAILQEAVAAEAGMPGALINISINDRQVFEAIYGVPLRGTRFLSEKKEAQFDDELYRITQWMIAKAGQQLGLSAGASQAAAWLYGKMRSGGQNLGTLRGVVGKGYEVPGHRDFGSVRGAFAFGDPAYQRLRQANLNKETGLTPNLAKRIIPYDQYPQTEMMVQSAPWALFAEDRVVQVSSKQGGLGITGEKAELKDLMDIHNDVFNSMKNAEGTKIKALEPFEEMLGFKHWVEPRAFGTYEGVEPDFAIRIQSINDDAARFTAALLGDAFQQEAAVWTHARKTTKAEAEAIEIVGNTKNRVEHKESGVHGALYVGKIDGTPYSRQELEEIAKGINPTGDMGGFQFSTDPDLRGIRFYNIQEYSGLDDVEYFEGLVPGLKSLSESKGLNFAIGGFEQQQGYMRGQRFLGRTAARTGYMEGGERGSGYRKIVQDIWDQYASEQPPNISGEYVYNTVYKQYRERIQQAITEGKLPPEAGQWHDFGGGDLNKDLRRTFGSAARQRLGGNLANVIQQGIGMRHMDQAAD